MTWLGALQVSLAADPSYTAVAPTQLTGWQQLSGQGSDWLHLSLWLSGWLQQSWETESPVMSCPETIKLHRWRYKYEDKKQNEGYEQVAAQYFRYIAELVPMFEL